MQSQPKLPSSDDAGTEVRATPAGQTEELEEEIEEHDAEVGPDAADEAESFDGP